MSNHTGTSSRRVGAQPDAQRNESFARALDELRREVESQLGSADFRHITRIGKLSDRLEILGRSLIHFCFEPIGFAVGTAALTAHKLLELMEIGHMALHGAYDDIAPGERFASQTFRWKAPIDEASWRMGHNVRHHQHTNIEGKDPDLNFGVLRLSPRVPYRLAHALQPVTNLASWLGFATAINLHVTGMLDIYLHEAAKSDVLPDRTPATLRSARRAFRSKFVRYYGREFVFFPALAGPFFGKVLLANVLSDVGRDLYAGAIIYCGHVGATDYARNTEPECRAHWYVMQVEAARDVELPNVLSILAGGLDLQIEHHLFPRLPPNRLREIAPRLRAICEAHGVRYRSASWPQTLRSVLGELQRMSSRDA
jgi:linoleoyl-CoA desaturase